MPDLLPHEVEDLRRSAAMLAPNMPSGLSAGQAAAILGQLAAVAVERDHLVAELDETKTIERNGGPHRRLVIVLVSEIKRGDCKTLTDLVSEGAHRFDEIHLAISCHGGAMDEGIAIYESLSQLGVEITTHNFGYVQSAALLVYLAGTTRLVAVDATFMIHATSYEPSDSELASEMTDERARDVKEDLDRLDRRNHAIISSATTIPDRLLNMSLSLNQMIIASHAVSWGLAHGIAPIKLSHLDQVISLGTSDTEIAFLTRDAD